MERLIKDRAKIVSFIILISLFFIDSRVDLMNCFFKINISFNIIALLFIAMMLADLFFRKKIQIDFISFSLGLLLIYYVIQYIFFKGYSGNLFLFINLLCCFCVYMFFKNSKIIKHYNHLTNILLFSGFVLSLQVIITRVILLFQKLHPYQIKGFLQIPLGGSNYIATFLLVIFVLLVLLKVKNKKVKLYRNVILLMVLLSIIITKSDGAILSVLLFLCFYGILRYKSRVVHSSFFEKNRKIIVIGVVCLLLVIFVLGFIVAMNLSFEQLNSLSSGRIAIYIQYFDAIKQKLIFGWGFYYEQMIGNLAHNWVLSNLLYGGIIGLLIALFPFMYLCYLGTKKELGRKGLAILILFVFIFIHSAFEPNLGTIKFDMFFWMIVGIGMKDVKLQTYEIELKQLIQIDKKKLIYTTSVILVLFVSIVTIQYNGRSDKYIASKTLRVTPIDIRKLDVYSLSDSKLSVYNGMLFKVIKQSGLNQDVHSIFEDQLSYVDVLDSVSVTLENQESTFNIDITTDNKQLSKEVCEYVDKYLRNIFQTNNKKDKVVSSTIIESYSKGENFKIVVVFEFLIFLAIWMLIMILNVRKVKVKAYE